jgi:dimethylhistidine N-methyltransferase
MPRAASASTLISASPFARAVAHGLTTQPKQIPSSWLYDDLGSALFEAICVLPWYRVTRAERELLDRHAAAIGDACSRVTFVAELGPGSGEKLASLMRGFAERPAPPAVHLIDVSPAALSLATRTLASEGLEVITTDRAEYLVGIDGLDRFRRGDGAALVAFLGSNIGNFHWRDAVALLRRLRSRLRPGDRVLLGTDLVKPEQDLLLAYDDPLGVTAAFNKNLLVRINGELGARFDLDAFDHRAVWNRAQSRMEMHLVSRAAQDVAVPGAGCVAAFAPGEAIWTESSYKFEPGQLDALASAVGLSVVRTWIHAGARFALTLFEVDAATAVR